MSVNKHFSQEEINKYFNREHGFDKYKPYAIGLLRAVSQIFAKYNIDYSLISGTLLGYIRHSDFIPWDDDIDIIVDEKILILLDSIRKEYSDVLTFINVDNYLIKMCFKSEVKEIKSEYYSNYIKKDYLNTETKYNWPFVDLFVYKKTSTILNFFNKDWLVSEFYPLKEVDFLGVKVKVPINLDYFLKINYGEDYMKELVSPNYNHKEEEFINEKIKIKIE
jgi:phosphorylcholine metabolism protein LicD